MICGQTLRLCPPAPLFLENTYITFNFCLIFLTFTRILKYSVYSHHFMSTGIKKQEYIRFDSCTHFDRILKQPNLFFTNSALLPQHTHFIALGYLLIFSSIKHCKCGVIVAPKQCETVKPGWYTILVDWYAHIFVLILLYLSMK